MQDLDLKLPKPDSPKRKKMLFRLACLLIVLLFLGATALYRAMENSDYEPLPTSTGDSDTPKAEAGFSVEAMKRTAVHEEQTKTPVAAPDLSTPAESVPVEQQKKPEPSAPVTVQQPESLAAPETPLQPEATKLETLPILGQPVHSTATQQLMALQVELELKKLQLAVTEVDAQIAKSDSEIMKLQAPVFMPAQAVSQAPAEAAKEPAIISIQGMNGAFSATIRTSAGLQTVKVGDAVNAAKVESITLERVVVSENGQSKSLAFED